MDYRTIWEDLVFGGKATIPQTIESSGSGDIVELFRYVLSDVLQWDAATAASRMGKPLLEFLNLSRMSRHLPCPAGVDMEVDKRYIAEAVWPDRLRATRKDRAEETYEAICDKRLARFPKNFFHGADCAEIACICLRYAINRYSDATSDEELFLRAADTREARSWLTKRKLLTVCDDVFHGDPLEFLRHAMANVPGAESWAAYAAFRQAVLDAGVQAAVEEKADSPEPVRVTDALAPFRGAGGAEATDTSWPCPAGYRPAHGASRTFAPGPWDPVPEPGAAAAGIAEGEAETCPAGCRLEGGGTCPAGLTLETCRAYAAFRAQMKAAITAGRKGKGAT